MSQANNADHSDQVDEVLADYMTRIDRGEPVNRERFAHEHPGIADELLAYFADEKAVVDWLRWSWLTETRHGV